MTVTYTAQVATCRGFGCFLKLLFRWRGSIYKLVWLDLVAFLFLYYLLNIMYRVALNDHQKLIFESIVKYCELYSNLIPLSFVLGFYVSIVMTRWWSQYTSIPWPDSLAVYISAYVHGQDDRGRTMRRTVMRYVCLCLTMVLTNISPRVKKRFPTMRHLVDAGLLAENESYVMESMNKKFPRHSKHWMPVVWAASIVTRARKEGRIRDDFAVKTIIDELNKFRGQLGLLISYDTISVPLVYTQVVTLAVYSFFLTSIMGQQWVENKKVEDGFLNVIDLYFPIFTTLQFFFYMGWLKVAESLINPFGEDDDDFEVSWIIDRNLQVSYMIVDEMHHEHPELVRDQYWDEIPTELPYTVASAPFREQHPEPSTANIELTKIDKTIIPGVASSIKVNDMVGKSNQSVNYKFPEKDFDLEADDDASGIHFTVDGRGNSYKDNRMGSSASLAGSMTRVNTVASALKRFFSREDSRTGPSTPDVALQVRLPGSASTASLTQVPPAKTPQTHAGSVRITDQVIEEVDEQLTITSLRGGPETRPTAQSIFSNVPLPVKSDPVDVPQKRQYGRGISTSGASYTPNLSLNIDSHYLSTSAPPTDHILTPLGIGPSGVKDPHFHDYDKSRMGSQETNGSVTDVDNKAEFDHFEQLRVSREKERQKKMQDKIIRTISNAPPTNVPPIDPDQLLEHLNKIVPQTPRNSYIEPPNPPNIL